MNRYFDLGRYTRPITTQSTEAQMWFDRGPPGTVDRHRYAAPYGAENGRHMSGSRFLRRDAHVELRGSRAAPSSPPSEQKVPLRHRQHFGGLAGKQFAVCAHFVGFGDIPFFLFLTR